MKNKLHGVLLMISLGTLSGCVKTSLDATPVNNLPESIAYSDRALVQSILGNFYISVNYGQNNGNFASYHILDEASTMYGPATTTDDERQIPRNFNRVYDYGLVRRMNQFLQGIRSTAAQAIEPSVRRDMEAQCRFLRAWYYFCMARSIGGMPLVGDVVFDYQSAADIPNMQVPRATEAATYRYIISECDLVAANLTAARTTNSAVANKWAAYMLKARAALYAASIAKYGSTITPNVRTTGWEAGIPTDSAAVFYRIAIEATDSVIQRSPYAIQTDATNPGLGFYRATSVKSANTEVIWAFDRLTPNQVTQFTSWVAPYSHRDYTEGNALGAVLNLVEAFENKDGSNPAIRTTNTDGSYVFYNSVEDPFTAKDARLWGTVIWPSAPYRNVPVGLQAGQVNKNAAGAYVLKAGIAGSTDPVNGELLTAINGPVSNANNYVNKTGFIVRKFLDETPNSGLNPRFSEMWMPRFRIAEAYLIAAEARFEMGDRSGPALQYINAVRSRGGIQPLTPATFTFDKIVNENRVEFAFEDHRFWDLKRWRLAHTIWNGVAGNATAQIYSLYPYKVVSAGDANNGKWVFTKDVSYKRATTPLSFPITNYYGTIEPAWITNNPKLIINPLQ